VEDEGDDIDISEEALEVAELKSQRRALVSKLNSLIAKLDDSVAEKQAAENKAGEGEQS
jgi:hypothetical protein